METIKLNIDMEYGRREPVEFRGKIHERPIPQQNVDGTRRERCTVYLSNGQRIGHIEQWSDDQPDSPVHSSLQSFSEPDLPSVPVDDKTIDPDFEQPLTLGQALAYSCPPQGKWLTEL